MARSAKDYLHQLYTLLPRGAAWSRAVGSRIYEYLYAQAEELARIDDRANKLITERDTRYTNELMDDHEEDLGLPDFCVVDNAPFDPELTLAERRLRALTKLTQTGQQNKEYFIGIAASLGYTATITEYFPATCGISECGIATCGDYRARFYWSLNVETFSAVEKAICGEAQCGDLIRKVSDLVTLIFCLAELYKPAHTILIHNTLGEGFSNGFSQGFFAKAAAGNAGGFSKGFSTGFYVLNGGGFEYDGFSSGFEKQS